MSPPTGAFVLVVRREMTRHVSNLLRQRRDLHLRPSAVVRVVREALPDCFQVEPIRFLRVELVGAEVLSHELGLDVAAETVFPGDAPSEPEKSEGRATRKDTFRQRAVRSRTRRLVAVVSPVEPSRKRANVAQTRARILAPRAKKK